MSTPLSNTLSNPLSATRFTGLNNTVPTSSPTSWFARLLATAPRWDLLLLRVPVGITFAMHGAQKLFGWFGGYGLQGTAEFMGTLGVGPGMLLALLAGCAEFFGGLALVLGLLVRPAAAALAFTMLVAWLTVHAGNGFFLASNGFEYAFVLLATSLALCVGGGGRLSADGALAGDGARS